MGNEVFSNLCSASLIKETALVPVIPNVFFYLNDEDLAADYGGVDGNYIAGNRSEAQKSIKKALPAPVGTINIDVEPATFGHFLNGVCGGFASGAYLPITAPSGAFTVGETVHDSTPVTPITGVVAFDGGDYLLITGASGDFLTGGTLTGETSSKTATITRFDAAVYGHAQNLPVTLDETYTLQFNYVNNAIRFYNVRFTGFDAVGMSDNKITCGVKCMCGGQFRHAKVMAQLTAGSGAKSITVDQTSGLKAAGGDTIKVFRPSTGVFLDFASTGVKTHTTGTISTETAIPITNLETQLEVGDLIVLAPQTATYSTSDVFIWQGGSTVTIGATLATLATAYIEEFSIVLNNEFEERWSAGGSDIVDRFPTTILQKQFRSTGSIKAYYQDEGFVRNARLDSDQAMRWKTEGGLISTSAEKYTLRFDFSKIHYEPFETNMKSGEIINQEINWKGFYSETDGREARALLINATASY